MERPVFWPVSGIAEKEMMFIINDAGYFLSHKNHFLLKFQTSESEQEPEEEESAVAAGSDEEFLPVTARRARKNVSFKV